MLVFWQRQALEQDVPSSAERIELKRLRADLKRVETERDMLKKRDHLLPTASVMTRYEFIAARIEPWPVQVLCRALAVSPAGYHR